MSVAPAATLAGFAAQYAAWLALGWPLPTDVIAEWIMARTPSPYAVWLLDTFGAWAKPFAVTGGLAAMGVVVLAIAALPLFSAVMTVLAPKWAPFWLAAAALAWSSKRKPARFDASRRTSLVMAAGAAVVAVEAFARNEVLARRAVEPSPLFPFEPPPDIFAPGLVRKAVTPVGEFYSMSKNAVDPVVNPHTWRLKVSWDGRTLREFSYAELLTLPRTERYVTLRCISNTLQSDLMGNAAWSGIGLRQLVSAAPAALEVAFVGVDGHGDSLPIEYAMSEEVMLAIGMNGNTLDRTHGFPVRLLAPRYYGFKNIKWIGEIAFVTRPYAGTWPAMGWKKEAHIHTVSHIDHVLRQGPIMRVGGVSFAGSRGIRLVEVRGGDGEWRTATLERALSPYAWTRWRAEAPLAERVEARAMDGDGRWQSPEPTGMFPSGVSGPTVKHL